MRPLIGAARRDPVQPRRRESSHQLRRDPAPTAQTRRDPAPTRWQYRWNRLWLTPMFRLTVRVGMPLAAIAAALTLWFSDADRRQDLVGVYENLRDQFQNRPEFMVNLLAVEGASPVLATAIRVGLAIDLPKSSFDIDLEAARALVEKFGGVARADVRVMQGGVLQVTVTERLPSLVWRARDGVWLVDATGHIVGEVGSRVMRGDLPLIAGEGAATAAPEALALIEAAGPLMPRLRGLVRMGERRWDLVLDRDQRLLLPELNPVRALERLIALDAAEKILARDITAVDLRSDGRPTLRLTAAAADSLRQFRLAQTGG